MNNVRTWGDVFRHLGIESIAEDGTYAKLASSNCSRPAQEREEVEFEQTVTRMKASFGWRLYRNDGKAEIHFSFFKSLFCKHDWESVQYATGGGIMGDVYNGKVCTCCGKKDIHKV